MHDELGRFSTAELAAIARYWFEQGRRSVARDSLIATGTPRAEAERLSRFHGAGEPLVIPEAGAGPMLTVAEANAPRRGRPPKLFAGPTGPADQCTHPPQHRGRREGLRRGQSICLVCGTLIISGSEIVSAVTPGTYEDRVDNGGEPEVVVSGGEIISADDAQTLLADAARRAHGLVDAIRSVDSGGGSSDTTYDEPPRAAEPDGGKAPATLTRIVPWAFKTRQAEDPVDDVREDPGEPEAP
jgi:hypothetical protein